MSYLSSTITGRYEVIGNPSEADCIQVHSFGTGGVNGSLGDLAINYSYDRLPIMADRNAALPLERLKARHVSVVAGEIGNSPVADRPGTWGALQAMFAQMAENDWHNPVVLGHARHIGRILRQMAKLDSETKLGVNPIVPPDLPKGFDHDSKQIWTKSVLLWIPYEMAATAKLKRDGQL